MILVPVKNESDYFYCSIMPCRQSTPFIHFALNACNWADALSEYGNRLLDAEAAELMLQVQREVLGLFHLLQIFVEVAGRFVQSGVLHEGVLLRVRRLPVRRDGLLRVRRRIGRLRSSACGRRDVSTEDLADGDHQLRCHGVVLVVAHAAVGEGSSNRDHALLPEAPEDEHQVAGPLRVRGEDLVL